MLTIYPACFVKDEQGYTVVFPDWDNAVSFGSDINDAMNMAVDCLAGLVFDCRLNNAEVPSPSSLETVDKIAVSEYLGCNPRDMIVNLVSVDAEAYAKEHFEKYVKKTVTIREWQNREGMRLGLNFSQLLQDALTARLRSAASGKDATK